MIVRCNVSGNIDPTLISGKCRRAERSVAIQAERDTRQFVPKLTGKLVNSARVTGNVITWDGPYARNLYWGHVMVDPKKNIAGFQTTDGWRSRRGVKKMKSSRTWNFTTGSAEWFDKSKHQNIGNWLKLAEMEIARSGKD